VQGWGHGFVKRDPRSAKRKPASFPFHVSPFTFHGTMDAARLADLARPDKWFLSAGDGVIWAPHFPVWLHRPGFWDEAMVHYHPFAPVFSVALLGPGGREVPLERAALAWRPGSLTLDWAAPDRTVLREHRTMESGGRLVSSWSAPHAAPGSRLVAFSAQPGDLVPVAERVEAGVRWTRRLTDRRGGPLDVRVTLSAEPAPAVVQAVRSEPSAPHPEWRCTPFFDRWDGRPADDVRLEGLGDAGLVYLAVAVSLEGAARAVRFVARLEPLDPDGRAAPVAGGISVEAFAARFPTFSCSDQFHSRSYAYRVYGLHLNRLGGGAGHVRHPAIAEGIGYFHLPITYSAQCHMWETRWARDPAEARGSLQNFLDAQKPDGGFHGRLYTRHLERTDFYHANWGDAVLALDAAAPDSGFLERAYEGLSRYARWLDATRDRERSGLYDVIDQYETGQEYMSRYQAVDPDADRYGWENRIRLKGVDVTVYAHQLKRALAEIAGRLDRARQADAWRGEADHIAEGLLGLMWDDALGLFSDVDPRSMHRTGVKAAVCFYPLLTDLLDETHVRRLMTHLDDRAEFATPFPVPSSSVDDPLFDPDAEWKGKRHNCPWNGRVWPMTNSHVIEGLLRQWRRGRRLVGPAAARILTRTVRMMFHDGDPARPNCYEHYHPVTGRASVYRGIDDYQHSWILDLLIRGVAGLDVDQRGLALDPLPVDVEWVTLDDLVLRGRRVAVERRGEVMTLRVDGRAYAGTAGTPIEVAW
jgi:hypothetical protein